MKKFFLILLVFVVTFGLFSCGQKYELEIVDSNDYIYDKPVRQKFACGEVVKLHCKPILDVDLAMYVNGQFKTIQTSVPTDGGFIWEYVLEMPSDNVRIEFKITRRFYSFADLFPWVNDLNERTLKKVKIEDGYIGVAPDTSNPTVKYSTDQRDIAYNLSVLKETTLDAYVHGYDISGGWYRKITYFAQDTAVYQIYVCNGFVYKEGGACPYYGFYNQPASYPDVLYGQTAADS